MVGNRRKARERALQLLYQDEYVPGTQRLSAERYFWDEGEGAASKDEVRLFCMFLVDGVRANRDAIDEIIRGVARNWKIERMSRVDRNILRFATFELQHAVDIPAKVSLNEAIEIAKSYGAEDSGAFINGILDKVSRQVGRPGSPDGPEAPEVADGEDAA